MEVCDTDVFGNSLDLNTDKVSVNTYGPHNLLELSRKNESFYNGSSSTVVGESIFRVLITS